MTRRGEIRIVDLDPAVGAEAAKRRPCVVVSNDRSNEAVDRYQRGVITVVPLTSSVATIYPFQVLIEHASGLRQASKAQCEQIRAVALERVGRMIGEVPQSDLAGIDRALRIHLQL